MTNLPDLSDLSYPWRQGYKTYRGASLRERRSNPEVMNPYDQPTQPKCYAAWLDGWEYGRDEAGEV